MSFLSDAREKQQRRARFFGPWIIAAFVFAVIIILIIFFPKREILSEVEDIHTADPVSANYLKNLIKTYPDKLRFRILFARQQYNHGKVLEAKKILKEVMAQEMDDENLTLQVRWLNYQIQRDEAYGFKPGSTESKQAKTAVKSDIETLAKTPLGSRELTELAKDALYFGSSKTAVEIYISLLKRYPDQSAEWFANAGRVALSVGDYRNSARFYLLAKFRSKTIAEKRLNFINALKSLQAGDMVNQALVIANRYLTDLKNDKKTLIFLTKLALAANKPQLAQKYAISALQLQYKE